MAWHSGGGGILPQTEMSASSLEHSTATVLGRKDQQWALDSVLVFLVCLATSCNIGSRQSHCLPKSTTILFKKVKHVEQQPQSINLGSLWILASLWCAHLWAMIPAHLPPHLRRFVDRYMWSLLTTLSFFLSLALPSFIALPGVKSSGGKEWDVQIFCLSPHLWRNPGNLGLKMI